MAGVLQYALSLSTSAFTGPASGAMKAIHGIGSAAGSAAGLVAKIAAPLAALGGGIGVLSALGKAADMETLNVSMGVLIGNAKETERVMKSLKQFADVTPFTDRDVMVAGKNLLALGSGTATLTDELRALGDVASGMSIPLNDLVEIYGKARTQGTLYAEDLNQLGGRGIPIFKALASVLKVSESEIKGMASEGQITFPMLQKVFSDLTAEGGKFYQMMDKQSGTTNGLLSTLKSAFDSLLVSIGTPINDLLKPMLESNINRLQQLNQRVVAYIQLLSGASKEGRLGEFLGASLKLAMITAVNVFSAGIRGTVAYMGAAFTGIFKGLSSFLKDSGIGDILLVLADAMTSRIKAGLLDLLSIIPGLTLPGEAAAERKNSEIKVVLAGRLIENMDLSKGITTAVAEFKKANDAGNSAYDAATKNPLIDPKKAKDEFAKISKEINPSAYENFAKPAIEAIKKETQSLEKALGGLNLKAPPKAPTKAELDKIAQQSLSARQFAQENAILQARISHRDRLAQQLEREMKLEQLKLDIMDKQGLSAKAAGAAAEKRLALEDKAAGISRKGVLDWAASLTARAERKAEQDQKREDRRNRLTPKQAADQLARGNAAADPGQVRREELAEAKRKAEDPMYRVVKSIEEKFGKLATA